jgi:hypothetical protein
MLLDVMVETRGRHVSFYLVDCSLVESIEVNFYEGQVKPFNPVPIG